MSIDAFMVWLEATPLSVSIRESLWSYPIIETVHVLGLALFLGFTILLDLRLLGLVLKTTPASEVSRRLERWIVAGFVVMVVSGVLLFYGDPVVMYESLYMRIKFGMLALAGVNVLMFKRGAFRNIAQWDLSQVPPKGAKVAAAVSLTLWFGIVAAGRAIAYFLPPGH